MPCFAPRRTPVRRRLAVFLALSAALSIGTAAAQVPPPDSAAAGRSVTLAGRVADVSGKPISNVSVAVTELKRGATTGDDGRYAVPSLPPGVYHVSFQRLGYSPIVRHLALGGSTASLDVVLAESLIELPGAQVSASATATTPLTSPQPISVLGGEALRQAQSPSLGGTLEQLPGLRSWSTGSGVGKPTIRGMRSDRVVVASNDIRLDQQGWGDEHGPQVESADVERIEVIRGPASVLYGSDAIGGVIHVIPKVLPVAFGRSPFVGGQAFGAFGSVDRNAGGGLALEGAARGLGFRGSFTRRLSGDVEAPDGALFNSGNEATTGAGAVGVRGARGSLDLSYTHREERVEIHEDPVESPGFTGYQKITDDLGRLSAIVPVGPSARLEVNVGAERNRRREFESQDDPTVALGLLARTYNGVVHFHHTPIVALEGLIGASIQSNRFTKFGEESLIPASTGTDVGLFAFEQAELGRWRLAVGARVDHRTLEVEEDDDLGVAAQTRDWNAMSGNAGVLYRVAEPVAIAVNVGRGFRAPSNVDLFSNGVHEGTIAFERGNPDLEVETSLNADVALRVETSRVRAELGGFVNAIDDFIYSRPTGAIDPGSGFEIFETVQGNARLAGFEVSAEFHPERHVHVTVSSDLVRGDNTDTNRPLPWIPPLRALYGVRYEPDAIGWAKDAYVGVRGESVARQDRLDPFDTAVPSYTLVHAEAGLVIPFGERSLTLDVTARNLADKAYRDFMSRYKTYANAPGRNLAVRVTMQF